MTERHFHLMALDLTTGPIQDCTLPDGFILEPMSLSSVAEYGRLVALAYGADHVDHGPDDDDPVLAAQVIERSLHGDDLGPWLPDVSAHVRHDGSVVAAIVVSDRTPSTGSPDGPWISELFVDPAFAGQGLGSALVAEAANNLIAAGRTHLGLAVTHGNPAIHVYERLGFRIEREVRRRRQSTSPDGGTR